MQTDTHFARPERKRIGRFWERLTGAIRNNKRLEYAVYGGIALIAVILYAASLMPKKADEGPLTKASEPTQAARVEQRLRSVLGCIRGAGRVEVMVTYESGTELVTAMSTNVSGNASETSDGQKLSVTSQTTQSSQPATVDGAGGNEPIILMEKEPAVRGVIVVAEGAADIRVKLDLQRAVQAVLDVPLSKIEVFELSSATAADARE